MNPKFWRNKKVLVTGHTGFQGSWLSLWLQKVGSLVVGFSLSPSTQPNLFELASVGAGMTSLEGNIENLPDLRETMRDHRPEIVIHLAGQALLEKSYADPAGTMATNFLGTVHVLEAVRGCASVQSLVCITSDKCYENREWLWGYREEDVLGGKDPYSASKAAAEFAIRTYRDSFFTEGKPALTRVASARAGNVIGGGDWAPQRLVPNVMTALIENRKISVRCPQATRPWQHVLDAVHGYLVLAEGLYEEGDKYAEAWNFGPLDAASHPVSWLVDRIINKWGGGSWEEQNSATELYEHTLLQLDSTKAWRLLGWRNKLNLDCALQWTVDWYRSFAKKEDLRSMTTAQIEKFQSLDYP